MRNGRYVRNGRNRNTYGLERSYSGLASGTRSLYENLYAADTVLFSGYRSLFASLLSGKRSALSGASEAERAGAARRNRVALLVGEGNKRIVKGRVDMNLSLIDIFGNSFFG